MTNEQRVDVASRQLWVEIFALELPEAYLDHPIAYNATRSAIGAFMNAAERWAAQPANLLTRANLRDTVQPVLEAFKHGHELWLRAGSPVRKTTPPRARDPKVELYRGGKEVTPEQMALLFRRDETIH